MLKQMVKQMLIPNKIEMDYSTFCSLLERNYNPILIRIIGEISKNYPIKIIKAFEYKPKEKDKLHARLPVEEIDLDPSIYTKEELQNIVGDINRRWSYQPFPFSPKNWKTDIAFLDDYGLHIRVTSDTMLVSV